MVSGQHVKNVVTTKISNGAKTTEKSSTKYNSVGENAILKQRLKKDELGAPTTGHVRTNSAVNGRAKTEKKFKKNSVVGQEKIEPASSSTRKNAAHVR